MIFLKCKIRFIYVGFNCKRKKGVKKCLEICAIKGWGSTPNSKCHFKFPFFSNLSQSDTMRRWKRYTHKYQNCSGIYASMHLLEEEKFPTWSGYPSRHHHDYLATSISLWFGTLANDHLNETDLASSHKDEIFAGENAASIAHHFIFHLNSAIFVRSVI